MGAGSEYNNSRFSALYQSLDTVAVKVTAEGGFNCAGEIQVFSFWTFGSNI